MNSAPCDQPRHSHSADPHVRRVHQVVVGEHRVETWLSRQESRVTARTLHAQIEVTQDATRSSFLISGFHQTRDPRQHNEKRRVRDLLTQNYIPGASSQPPLVFCGHKACLSWRCGHQRGGRFGVSLLICHCVVVMRESIVTRDSVAGASNVKLGSPTVYVGASGSVEKTIKATTKGVWQPPHQLSLAG